jgi:hypothetical protein
MAYALKRLYSKKPPENTATRKRPVLSRLRKEDGFTGDGNFYVPVEYANPQAVANTFSGAQGISGYSRGLVWVIPRKTVYGIATVDGIAMEASRDDMGAFLKFAQKASDSTLDEMGRRLSQALFSDGTGYIGQRASISTNTITLSTADDAKNFMVGMYVGAVSSGSARTGTTYVTAVDYDNGKVTVNSAAAITSFADNDYLVAANTSTTDYNTFITGLAGYFPLTAPSSGESFLGVDRSVDTARLSGARVNDTSSTIQENALTVATRIKQIGGECKQLILNPLNYTALIKDLGTKVERPQGGQAVAGFSSAMFQTACGDCEIISDPDCPTNRGYLINLDSMYLKTLGSLPHLIDQDGNSSLRVYNEDSVEWRFRAAWNLVVTKPSDCGVFAI